MKIFGRKDKRQVVTETEEDKEVERIQEKLRVEILGKGETTVPVTKETTVSDIRNMLSLDSSVQALDEEGRKLRDNESAKSVSSGSTRGKLNFIPNVEGGNE